MGNHNKGIDLNLGNLSGAAIKKQARDERKQERISWIVQLAVPVILIAIVSWICGPLFFEYLNSLSEAVKNSGGNLK